MSVVVLAAVLPVQAAPDLTLEAQLGIGGWVVPGRFVPLRVEVDAARDVRGILEVDIRGSGGASVTHEAVVRVPQGGRQQIAFDVVIVDPRRDVLLRVRGEETRMAIPVGVAHVAEGIVVAVTEDPAGLEFLAAAGGKRRPAYLHATALPSSWQGYDAVDLVAVRDLDARALLPAQEEALIGWVAQGGRLLVTPHEGRALPSWLVSVLPARIASAPSIQPGIPVPLARLLPNPGAAVIGDAARPLAVRGGFGHGVVEVWAFDPFSPEGRTWPDRLPLWRSLLDAPRPAPAASPTLADELPRTRPLPGSTQLVLALLSVAYVAVIRIVLRRFGPARGGWVIITAVVAAFALVLYGSAASARRSAGSIAQVSIIEDLAGAGRARVDTVVSLITPYGGPVSLVLPEGAVVRPIGAGELRIVEGEGIVTADGRTGHGILDVSQIVPLDLRAAAMEQSGMLELIVAGSSSPPRDALLYRSRQMYRIGGVLGARTVLDPARWEPLDRPGTLGTDLPARATEWVLRRLDASGGDMWLVGRWADGAVGVRLRDGGGGQAVELVVIPVRLR